MIALYSHLCIIFFISKMKKILNFRSNSKKRPNNITIGRVFDNQILDMVEFGIENFESQQSFLVFINYFTRFKIFEKEKN